MGKTTGFIEFQREAAPYRDANERLLDFDEIYTQPDAPHLEKQGARCMDCGVPFCQSNAPREHRIGRAGCPIHNLIPEWNDLVYRGQWRDALDRLHATNNFPEFTGRVCPAPCEGSCVLGITDPPVTIKNIEMAIIDRGFAEGWVRPQPPVSRTGKSIAIVGSGPAGLAAAAQLNRVGHLVTVYERADRIGGLLMYGIPNMKLDKTRIVDRRVQLLRSEGIEFKTGVDVGDGSDTTFDVSELIAANDAVLLTTGATTPRDLKIPGRKLNGIYFAMDFLTANTRSLLDSNLEDGQYINARDKDVVVIGGGDTGTDCLGTSLRHNCRSLTNFEVFPAPPDERAPSNPWPEDPMVFKVDYGHAEAAAKFGVDPRTWAIDSLEFIDDGQGNVAGIKTVDLEYKGGQRTTRPATERTWETNLVILAMGFLGPEHYVSAALGLDLDQRSNYAAEKGSYATSIPNVFAAGDCRSGQNIVVRAINEGREAAQSIDRHLMGSSVLPG
ncbi:MAG: glutamate synthase subunit beta [Pseudomonadales bacterium]|nr:glutamate synthase subunit beta [Pseudomonadales bacterium]